MYKCPKLTKAEYYWFAPRMNIITEAFGQGSTTPTLTEPKTRTIVVRTPTTYLFYNLRDCWDNIAISNITTSKDDVRN